MKQKNDWIISDILEAEKLGLEVYVDGKQYSSSYGRKKNVIKEEADYMSDYIYDENGKVVGIHFNKIRRTK